MEPENIVMQGILLLPPQGMLGQLKKTWHKKFCQLFKPSKIGIKRLEVFDSQEEAVSQPHSSKIITLEACVKIAPSNQPNVFTVVTKTGIHHYGCSSELDMTNWMNAFQIVAFADSFPQHIIEEDNDLYSTAGEGIFAVKLVESDASKRCKLEEKNYTLILAAADMRLMDGEEILFTWPYKFIRRYGYRDGKFTFEAGRKCKSGEGLFCLEHSSQQIFKCLSAKMKCMKRLLSGDSSPSIDFNNAQYHAALSMEAGSRSPLPPSLNSSGNLIDLEFSTISQNSQKYSNSSSLSNDQPVSFIKPPPPIIKPKPAKPPRRHMFTGHQERKSLEEELPDTMMHGKYTRLNSSSSTEFPSSCNNNLMTMDDQKNPYDSVEVRSDAWKTHGADNVLHTEAIIPCTSDEEAQYETMDTWSYASQSSTKSKTSSNDMVITPTCPIIHNNVSHRSEPPNYDKLQHFGSTHKLNQNSGYRTPNVQPNSQINVPALPPVVDTEPSSSWDDYEFIEDISTARSANDSSHGYGRVRKKVTLPNSAGPNHKIYNQTEYAVISKPRKV
ncbi:docking protein 3 [Neodiprion fabricii]|uniref:docking protein 3 n=1 Tax=Neodiprion fabricii TaxID=2872261 RepID=UPI001ED923CB|nr:docking protein 3 [Neodiprion fabricii]